MKKSSGKSVKRLKIDKANAAIMSTVAIAAFVTVGCLFASKALLSQRAYQVRVIKEKEKAVKQLNANLKAVETLKSSYTEFASTPQNMLGGNPTGSGPKDGDNPKLVLDSLPSKYDFPALATSLEKLLTERNFKILGISGTDEEISQQTNSESATPQPIEMPFQVTVGSTYTGLNDLINVFEHSIRPFQIQSMTLSGEDSNMQMIISGKTYYQPEKTFSITKKEVK